VKDYFEPIYLTPRFFVFRNSPYLKCAFFILSISLSLDSCVPRCSLSWLCNVAASSGIADVRDHRRLSCLINRAGRSKPKHELAGP